MLADMILFDANQIPQPHTPMMTMFKAAADRTGHALALTDIVLKEAVQRRHEDLTEEVEKFLASQKRLNKLLPPKKKIRKVLSGLGINEFTDRPGGREAGDYEREMTREFVVLETRPEDALESLFRETSRRAPCKPDGRGGRDTSIYLTALCAAGRGEEKGDSLPLIFVSNDKAFANPEGDGFNPDLRKEIGDRQMVLCRNQPAALEAIGYPQKDIDPTDITDLPEFQDSLREAMVDATPGYFDPQYVSRIREGAVQAARPARGGVRALRCSGDGLTLTTVSGTWVARVITGDIPEDLQKKYPGAYRGFPLMADATIAVVQDSSGNIVQMTFPSLVIDNSSYRSRLFPVSYE